MAYSATRLTLYAILSAIETDLRHLIRSHLDGQLNPHEVLGDDVYTTAVDRYEKEVDLPDGKPTLEQLLCYTDFSDAYKLLNRHKKLLPTNLARYLNDHTSLFEQLGQVRNRIAHTRPLHFDDLAVTMDAAQELSKMQEAVWQDLKTVLARLESEPSFVLNLQIPSYEEEKISHNLPTPDFDETGFLGRNKQLEQLLRLCRGTFPVITIMGEGGIGKTALAVKVAYDVLDLPDCPFESVVWTTSKSSQLSVQEIVRIEGAIRDSLGMLQRVTAVLGGDASADPIEEVLAYLQEFKILLILDNLETVLDQRINDFLARFGELSSGSKLLLTSRIGLGKFEYPIKLQPMDEGEAIQLLRALARIRGVEGLVRTSNQLLSRYCKQMKNNPGFIKWFVSAVQAGTRPEEVLARPDIFLDFCMSNVYKYLSQDSLKVLQALLCLPEQASQAELAFIAEMPPLTLQRSLQQLLTTNMVIMSSIPHGSSFDSYYGLGDLARSFLKRHHPVPSKQLGQLTHRRQQLIAANEQICAELSHDPYSIFSITVRTKSDLIIAKYLRDALTETRNKNFERAVELVAKARDLSPGYFEVYRVEAWVNVEAGNFSDARTAYEAAIEIEPKSAPLRHWFAGFLLRHLNDVEGALVQLKEAARLDPSAYQVQMEIARALLYQMKFSEVAPILLELKKRTDLLSAWPLRRLHDLNLQFFQRQADFRQNQKDNFGALQSLQDLRSAYEDIPEYLRDDVMKDKLYKAVHTARSCARFLDDADAHRRALELAEWLMIASAQACALPSPQATVGDPGRLAANPPPQLGEEIQGVIDFIKRDQGYGFVVADNGGRYYFNRRDVVSGEWSRMRFQSSVIFRVGHSPKGPCALDVRLKA